MSPIVVTAIIQAAIAGAIQIEPFIANLIQQHTNLQNANRPDVSDADLANLKAIIDGLQAHINQMAGYTPAP